MSGLGGRCVVVTGAGRGIGRGIARLLAGRGAAVVLVSRTAQDLDELAGEIAAAGGRALAVPGDVTDPTLPDRVLTHAGAAFGAVHGLVNNAGVDRFAPVWDQTDQQFDEVVATNLTGPFLLCQAFARHWTARGVGGVIVNVTSVEAEVAFPDQAPYAATKGGLTQLTKTLALELAPAGIRVNAVGPGVTETEMTPDRERERAAERIPMGRLATPEEVGRAVAFLLGEDAAYVTGTTLYVDGGFLLR
jgi:NAD(P)-dependent dehydrogenase (short-subunit alcohol dehydrogenase family)